MAASSAPAPSAHTTLLPVKASAPAVGPPWRGGADPEDDPAPGPEDAEPDPEDAEPGPEDLVEPDPEDLVEPDPEDVVEPGPEDVVELLPEPGAGATVTVSSPLEEPKRPPAST